MSLLIGNNTVVSIHYHLTNNDGEVLDSSKGTEPLAYLHGAGNIIPGLENALVGKAPGDSLKVTVSPEEGYGEIVPDLVQEVARTAFQGVDQIEVGMVFTAQGADGSAQRIVVKAVDGDMVTVDGNHPLAGQTLNFDVEVVGVRDATAEEIDHGHAH